MYNRLALRDTQSQIGLRRLPESRTELSQVISTARPVPGVIEKSQGCDVIHRQIKDKYTYKYTIITEHVPGLTDEHIIMNMVNLWAGVS